MKIRRFGQVGTLKEDKIAEYTKLHSAVWPGVLKTINECNLRNYSIYIKGNQVFAYFEYTGTDYDLDMVKMGNDPVTIEWWKHTKPCFEGFDKGSFYENMDEIFHFD